MNFKLLTPLMVLALAACDGSSPSTNANASAADDLNNDQVAGDPNNDAGQEEVPADEPVAEEPVDYGRKGKCLVALVEEQASTAEEAGQGCISCTIADAGAVITAEETDFAAMAASVALLPAGGISDIALRVDLAEILDPSVVPELAEDADETDISFAPSAPGFTVSFPDVAALSAGVAPVLTVDTLLAGAVVDTASYPFGLLQENLAVGSALQDINNAQVYLPVAATAPYDAIRLSLSATVANALMSVDVYQACNYGVAGSITGDF